MKRRFLFACLLSSLALPVAADAPPGRYTISNGTVYDTITKLTWQQVVDGGMYTQPDAINHCTNLTLAGGGWRLPKIYELLTIADRTRFHPAIDPNAFPSTPTDDFWSASDSVGSTGNGWIVGFERGRSAHGQPSSDLHRVRCVR
jgi:hypothetical protein